MVIRGCAPLFLRFVPVGVTLLSAIAACGGGGSGSSPPPLPPPMTNTYTIAGTVSGLAGTGLVLENNDGDSVAQTGNGAFSFTTPVTTGTAYGVTVTSQPTFPSQNCTVVNGSGTVTNANITGVSVNCVTIPPNLTASASSLSVRADTSQGAPYANNPLTFAVNNPDVHNYFYSISYGGTVVGAVNMNFVTSNLRNTGNAVTAGGNVLAPAIGGTILGQMNGTSLGVNSIFYNNPITEGSGSYSDAITIEVCYDVQCARQVPGSPITIPVTYVVTGNPISNAIFGYFPPSVQLESASTSTAAPVVTLNLTGNSMPPYGAHVSAHGGSGNLVSNIQFQLTGTNTDGSSTAVLTATLKPGENLSAGIYPDTLQVSICFDSACTKPATGSPWTVALQYIVAATAGTDFTMKTLNIDVSDVVWNPVSQKLYALVPGYSSVNPNTITQIDPFTGTLDRSVSLGANGALPGTLAISDDGQYLYAGVLSAPNDSVQRVLVSSLTLDTSFTLPSQQFISTIRVAPGLPHTAAISLNNPLPPGVVVYDDATPRTQGFSTANLFTWGADATSAFAFNANYPNTPTLYPLSVSSSGLTSSQSFGITLNGGSTAFGMLYSNQYLYWSDGTVFDTATNTQQPSFVMIPSTPNMTFTTGAMAVDASLDRAYFLNTFQPPGWNGGPLDITLESFKASDRTPLWLTHFSSQDETFVLTRWGSNGLALTTSGGSQTLVLISGPIVTK